VYDALPPQLQDQLRSLGPMYLRGKAETTEVYRVEWHGERDAEATVMGAAMFTPAREKSLQIFAAGRTREIDASSPRITLGRSASADMPFNDTRVSRIHATIEWRGGHFVLTDASSYGTWVYMGNQAEPMVLRRTECYLVGKGQIALGCEREAEAASVALFTVRV